MRLWPLQNTPGKPKIFEEGTPITAIAFSRDGRWLAAGNREGDIHLWDVRHSDAAPRRLSGHARLVSSLVFSENDGWLVSAGYDGFVRSWPLDMDSLLEAACQLIPQTISTAELEHLRALAERRPGEADLLSSACAEPVQVFAERWAELASFIDPALFDGAVKAFDQARILEGASGDVRGAAERISSFDQARRITRRVAIESARYVAERGDIELATDILHEAVAADPNIDLVPSTLNLDQDPEKALESLGFEVSP